MNQTVNEKTNENDTHTRKAETAEAAEFNDISMTLATTIIKSKMFIGSSAHFDDNPITLMMISIEYKIVNTMLVLLQNDTRPSLMVFD